MSEYLVNIKNERLSFFTPAGEVKALNDVSLHLKEGEVLGIVGAVSYTHLDVYKRQFVEEGDTAAGGYQILDGLHVLNFRFVFKIRYKEPPLFQNLLQNHPSSRARFPQQKPLSCQLLQGEREALFFLYTFHLKKEIRAADRNERFSQVDQIGVGGLGEISLQQGEIQRAVVDLRQQVSRIPVSYTHLDVYKRQGYTGTEGKKRSS